jgi:hypothetical protein
MRSKNNGSVNPRWRDSSLDRALLPLPPFSGLPARVLFLFKPKKAAAAGRNNLPGTVRLMLIGQTSPIGVNDYPPVSLTCLNPYKSFHPTFDKSTDPSSSDCP